MSDLKVYYRLSDKGNPKEKIPNADKFSCLRNAIDEFGRENIFLIADNCKPETVTYIRDTGVRFEETSLGNSASFMYMSRKIVNELEPDQFVYLLEDDYVHRPGSRNALLEGLNIADYVTLYDHPDKYRTEEAGGSPMNWGAIRPVRLFVSDTTHWRETDSTTMTFACRVRTLSTDLSIWERYCSNSNPDDFHAFMEIVPTGLADFLSFFRRLRKRESSILMRKLLSSRPTHTLISSVPALATHAETRWLAPVVNWDIP